MGYTMPPHRPSNQRLPEQHSAASETVLTRELVHQELTPRGLFTNLFPVSLPDRLDPLQKAPPSRARKGDLVLEYRRPEFYEAEKVVYAFGAGLEDFDDPRFARALNLKPDSERQFTKYLLRKGLRNLLHEKGFPVRKGPQGLVVRDPSEIIFSHKNVELQPEYILQPYYVEDITGSVSFAFALEVGWTTAFTFAFRRGVQAYEDILRGARLISSCDNCPPWCPLYSENASVVGVFDGFAAEGSELETECDCKNVYPIPVRVADRSADPPLVVIAPGHVLLPAPGQKGLLRMSPEQGTFETAARVWLGDLTSSGKVRAGALGVRYFRMQEFLTKLAGTSTGGIKFYLPTGQVARIGRIPISVEEVVESA